MRSSIRHHEPVALVWALLVGAPLYREATSPARGISALGRNRAGLRTGNGLCAEDQNRAPSPCPIRGSRRSQPVARRRPLVTAPDRASPRSSDRKLWAARLRRPFPAA